MTYILSSHLYLELILEKLMKTIFSLSNLKLRTVSFIFLQVGELEIFKGHMILLDRIHVFRFAVYSKIV